MLKAAVAKARHAKWQRRRICALCDVLARIGRSALASDERFERLASATNREHDKEASFEAKNLARRA
jgi:hypothetical protein